MDPAIMRARRCATLVFALLVLPLLVLVAPARAGDLTGVWEGYYEYGNGQQGVPFTMELTHRSSAISGQLVELQTFGQEVDDGMLAAALSGSASGDLLSFTKTYDGSGGVSHSVVYRGTVIEADNGTLIATGIWETDGTRGGWMAIKVE
jgi:hypothetical protein